MEISVPSDASPQHISWHQKRQQYILLPPFLRPFLPYWRQTGYQGAMETIASDRPHDVLLEALKFWIRICDGSHGSHCRPETPWPRSGPLWLIDVNNKCITPAKKGSRYVALSYVWGSSKSTMALCSNITSLQQPGSLGSVDIPQTLEDSMNLVERLGEEFLWADRLCIVQDDGATKASQLEVMGEIYAAAYFTIVAAEGSDARNPLYPGSLRSFGADQDVSCGCNSESSGLLPRLRETLQHERESKQGQDLMPKIYEDGFVVPRLCGVGAIGRERSSKDQQKNAAAAHIRGTPSLKSAMRKCHHRDTSNKNIGRHDVIMQGYSSQLQESTWFGRGWTFQEYIFSRRKLVFQGSTVLWECHCASWHEGQGIISPARCSRIPKLPYTHINTDPWPNIHRFARIASLFSAKNFTYPEDALDAFAGILHAFAPAFKGGFVTAVPQLWFHEVLLWQSFEPSVRRQASDRAQGNAILPSWSWISWNGDLQTESQMSAYMYIRQTPQEPTDAYGATQPCSWNTIPTVRWRHCVTLEDCGEYVETLSDEYRHFDPATHQLPNNWSSFTCPETSRPFYTHLSAPAQGFWHPIPIQDEGGYPPVNFRSRFLKANRFRRAELRISDIFENPATSRCCTANLRLGDGTWAGVVRLTEELEECSVKPGDICELIELSGGNVRNQDAEAVIFDEWILEECPRHTGLYEFFNVMWVEWDSGVAYRKAVGRVERDIWEGIAVDDGDLILG